MIRGVVVLERRVAPLRIIFFGLPLAALLLARDGHSIALAAVCRKDALGIRRAVRCFGQDRVLMKPDASSPALIERVRAEAPDVIVSWFWTKRLPMAVVRAARLGGIGVHPSLLPRHRGPDPTYWAIASGDAETGVTVHRIEEEYDTGDVLAQERLVIDPAWNAWQLARALDRPSLRKLRDVVRALASGEDVPAKPQDPALATQAPAPDDEACAIRWSWPTERVLRHIRALSPAPGAWTEIEGVPVTVLRAARAKDFPAALEAGEGAILGGRPVVRTADGAVALLEAEIEGEPSSAEELSALFAGAGPEVLDPSRGEAT